MLMSKHRITRVIQKAEGVRIVEGEDLIFVGEEIDIEFNEFAKKSCNTRSFNTFEKSLGKGYNIYLEVNVMKSRG